jgi:hypothetical protein
LTADEYVENFQLRVLQDAWEEATASYWDRRAAMFDDALPRPGDHVGQTSPGRIEARRLQVAAIALACRERAAIARMRKEG